MQYIITGNTWRQCAERWTYAVLSAPSHIKGQRSSSPAVPLLGAGTAPVPHAHCKVWFQTVLPLFTFYSSRT